MARHQKVSLVFTPATLPTMFAELLTMVAMAAPADRLIAGEQAMEALEYELAADEFMSVAVDPEATEAERLQAHLRAGFAHRVLGKDTDARLSFRYVLKGAPATRLPTDTPPKILYFFESVRQEVEADRAAGVSYPMATTATATAKAGESMAPAADLNGAVLAGGLLVSGGALAAIASGGFALWLEQQVGDPSASGAVRAEQLDAGRLSLVVAGVATVVGVVGGAVLALGAAP